MQHHGRASASRSAGDDPFASRPEMPVVLRGGMLESGRAFVPLATTGAPSARVPHRLGTVGWLIATAGCALSVYAVRDTMLAPLARSEAPSAWETPSKPGDTVPVLIAAPGALHIDLVDHDGTATGTTVPAAGDNDPAGLTSGQDPTVAMPSAPSTTGADPSASTSAPGTTADPTSTSATSLSTPDTLDGHGGSNGGGRGGSGSGSGTP